DLEPSTFGLRGGLTRVVFLPGGVLGGCPLGAGPLGLRGGGFGFGGAPGSFFGRGAFGGLPSLVFLPCGDLGRLAFSSDTLCFDAKSFRLGGPLLGLLALSLSGRGGDPSRFLLCRGSLGFFGGRLCGGLALCLSLGGDPL